ncbi:MAG: AAA-like domain-containing protein [Nitrospiraceae bacterium]
MKNVFISYRHVEPDQSLAQSIAKALGNRRLNVFVDTKMLVGTKWVDEIERQIRLAHFFIVLLSKQSILSDMVRREIKLAYDLSLQPKGSLKILPIRVAFDGELPYDLSAYLDPIHYAKWNGTDAQDTIIAQIQASIEQAVALPEAGKSPDESSSAGLQALAQATEQSGAPLPAADPRLDLELDTGSVKLSSPFYVRRGADKELERQVPVKGTTSIVKGPRQIGKSSLVARALAQAMKLKQRCCLIDFQLIPSSEFESLDRLLKHLARKIARGLNTKEKPQDTWDDDLDSMENLSTFVEEAVLTHETQPVLLALDEADRVFKFPYRDDFFSLIRGWHNNRATNELWCNLNIVIAHSTEPSLWIQNVDRSPFNVGLRLRLDDFTAEQISQINIGHGSPLKTDSDLSGLMNLVGGHPYLVRQSLYAMARNGWALSQLQTDAVKESGPFGDHLRQWVWRLQENRELRDELRTVQKHSRCDDEGRFQRLKAAGLVTGETRTDVRMRCRLYELYFKDHL